jgi:O-antigen ligase/tetratricopeptide (TPR) repeat protein
VGRALELIHQQGRPSRIVLAQVFVVEAPLADRAQPDDLLALLPRLDGDRVQAPTTRTGPGQNGPPMVAPAAGNRIPKSVIGITQDSAKSACAGSTDYPSIPTGRQRAREAVRPICREAISLQSGNAPGSRRGWSMQGVLSHKPRGFGLRAAERRRWPRAIGPVLAAAVTAALLAAFALVSQPPYGADPIKDGWERQALIGVALLCWIVGLTLRRRLPRPSRLSAALLLYLAAMFAANFANPDWRLGIEPLLDILAAILIFDALTDPSGLSQTSLRWALMLVPLALAALSLHVVWGRWQDWLTLIRAVPNSGSSLLPPTVPRVLGLGTNPNILAPVMTLPSPLFLAAIVDGRRVVRIAGALALVAVQVAVFFTLSRAAWIGEIAGFGVAGAGILLAYRALPLPSRRAVLAGCAIVATAMAVIVVLSPSIHERPLWLFRPSLAARSDFRSAAIQIIRRHPLLGAGPGRFPLLYPETSNGDPAGAVHSHNILLQIGVEGGVLAIVAAATIGVAVAIALWRRWRTGDRRRRLLLACVSGSLTAFVVGGMADSLHLFPEILFVLAGLLALALRDEGTAVTPQARRLPGGAEKRLNGGAALALSLSPLLLAVSLGAVWLHIDQAGMHYRRSISLASEEHWPDAAAEAARASAIDPHLALYHVQQGMTLAVAAQNSGSSVDRHAAIQQFELALALEPRSGATRLDLAVLLNADGQSTAAAALLPSITQESPRDAMILLGVGVLAEGMQAPPAIAAYAGALAENPRLADSPFWQSTPYRRAHFPEIVVQALARAEQEPSAAGYPAVQQIILDGASLPRARAQLPAGTGFISLIDQAEAVEASGDDARAASMLRSAISARADDPAARLALGNLSAKEGDLSGARRQWLAGAYLGDTGSILGLGNSFLPDAVPAQIQDLGQWSLLNLWLRQLSLTQQQYRFTYRRQEPYPIVLTGDWLNGLPRVYTDMSAAASRWKVAPGAAAGR